MTLKTKWALLISFAKYSLNIWKYVEKVIFNCNTFLTFYSSFDQISAALVSIRDLPLTFEQWCMWM